LLDNSACFTPSRTKNLCQKWKVKIIFWGAWNSSMAWPDWPWPRYFTTDLHHWYNLLYVVNRARSDVPSAPVGLRLTDTDAGRITLAWDAPTSDGGSAITGYVVEICRSGSTTGWTTGARVDGTRLSTELTGLSEQDLYFVRVFSENQAGTSKKPCELGEPISAKRPLRKPYHSASQSVAVFCYYRRSVFVAVRVLIGLRASCGAVYCNRACLFVCVCVFVCGSVTTITRKRVHRSSPNWVCSLCR